MNESYLNSVKNTIIASKPSTAIRLLLMVFFVGFTGFAQISESTPGSYAFIVPAGVTSVTVQVWGAGGGGGGSTNDGEGGSGGGSGGYSTAIVLVVAGQSISYTVGAGGTGGAGSTGTGVTGGASSFTYSTTTLTANGGAGGARNKGTVGAGGTATGGTNTTGNGGALGTTSGGKGGNAPASGGAGGAGENFNSVGNPGGIPGGGGGGGEYGGGSNKSGGAGGNGQVKITYTPAGTYKAQIISPTTGPAIWCAGETRTVSVTIKNIGTLPWTDTATADFNIGVKWNTNGSSWNDYNVRVDAQNLAVGATATYNFTITASNNLNGTQSPTPGYTTPLSSGTNNLTFDVVYESVAWFGNNDNGVGPGNTKLTTPAITINAVSSNPVPIPTITDASCLASDGAISIANLNNALEFLSANNKYVDLGSALLSNRNRFTIEGWVKFKKADLNTGFTSLFGQNDAIEFGFSSPTQIHLWTNNGGSMYYTLPVGFVDNAWHHIAAVGTGTNLIIYIDGISVATGGTSIVSGNYGSSTDFAKIGSGVFTPIGNSFTGQMMKIGMYSAALTAADIASLASSPTTYTGLEPGLIAGYNFFDGSGTTLKKLPAGTNGTLVATPLWKDPYTYSWTKTGDGTFARATRDITGLSAGDYNVSVYGIGVTCPKITSFTVGTQTTTWNGLIWTNGTPSSTKKIIFAGNYPPTTDPYVDITGCSCQVNSGNITINVGKTLTLTNELKVSGGSLTFENNASLVQINDVVNTGNIIYKRTTNTAVRNTDYTYWSTPVSPLNLGGTGGIIYNPSTLIGSVFYSYEVTAGAEDWKGESAATPMRIGHGYSVRGPGPISASPGTQLESTFTGAPNNGRYAITGIFPYKSYLIGNPYPSALDAYKFLTDNAGVIDGTLYFWTHSTKIGIGVPDPGTGVYAYSGNDYASYNLTGGTGTDGVTTYPPGGVAAIGGGVKPSGKIGAGQGFFATSNTTITGVNEIVFNNNMRVGVGGITGNNNQFFKTKNTKSKSTSSLDRNRIWLNLFNTQGAFKQTLVGYVTGASNEYDSAFDGETFDGNEFSDFYSINEERNFVIQGRALPFDQNDSVPLGYRVAESGAFSIGIDEVDGTMQSQGVFLEDKLLSSIHNLKVLPYTFTTHAGTFNDRFVLRYTDKTLGTGDFDKVDSQVVISKDKNELKIKSAIETIKRITVFDLLGKKVFEKEAVNSNEFRSSSTGLSKQVGIVKVTLANGQVISKKVVF